MDDFFNTERQDTDHYDAPDLTPADYADNLANGVARALENTRFISIIEVQGSVGQLHFLCRIKPKDEHKLKPVIVSVLRNVEGLCEHFIGKSYFLKNNEPRYGWVFSFASNDLQKTAHAVCEAIDQVIPRAEVLESPLMGPGTPLGIPGGAKGAMPLR